jgi:putative endopeptidase
VTGPVRGGRELIFSLPDRDYYFKNDVKSFEIRDAFVKHVAQMLEVAGEVNGAVELHAKTVMTFEAALAESVMKNTERSLAPN